MGKKKVIKQTEEELLKETSTQEKAMEKILPQTRSSRQVSSGKIFIHATYNNTIISMTDDKGNVLAWASSGNLGFKGPKKATPYAASKVAEAVVERGKKTGVVDVYVYVRGIGSGRESAVRSLATHGLNILSIKDTTPIPHNGPRPPKVRRV